MTLQPSRRDAMVLTGKALLGLMAAIPTLSGCGSADSPESGFTRLNDNAAGSASISLDWNNFIAEIAQLAETQFSSNWDQEHYVQNIAGLMVSLNLTDPHVEHYFSNYTNAAVNFPEITEIHWQDSFQVSVLAFEPGEVIALHDHPEMTGVMMCSRGQVEVDNYTLLEERSSEGRYLLQKETDTAMEPGMIGTLTSTKRNIHGLRATAFTEMIDVFTPPYNDARSYASKWYSRADYPYQGTENIFEANRY